MGTMRSFCDSLSFTFKQLLYSAFSLHRSRQEDIVLTDTNEAAYVRLPKYTPNDDVP
jgi:hypothetical protein